MAQVTACYRESSFYGHVVLDW